MSDFRKASVRRESVSFRCSVCGEAAARGGGWRNQDTGEYSDTRHPIFLRREVAPTKFTHGRCFKPGRKGPKRDRQGKKAIKAARRLSGPSVSAGEGGGA